jgi:hypothetical protein
MFAFEKQSSSGKSVQCGTRQHGRPVGKTSDALGSGPDSGKIGSVGSHPVTFEIKAARGANY